MCVVNILYFFFHEGECNKWEIKLGFKMQNSKTVFKQRLATLVFYLQTPCASENKENGTLLFYYILIMSVGSLG